MRPAPLSPFPRPTRRLPLTSFGRPMPDAPVTRLMLITPDLADTDAFRPAFEAALAAGDIAAVVIRLAPADDRTRLSRAKPLIAAAQQAGAAALIAGDGVEDMLGKSGADGVHLPGETDLFRDLVARFQPDKIVGAGALATRDGAMAAGEAGADYVMFGEADDVAFSATLERVEWWVPIFQTPCVGVARAIDDVAALAAADAEFAALSDAVWRCPDGPAAAVARAAAMLTLARAPTP